MVTISSFNSFKRLVSRARLLYRIQLKPLLIRRPIFFFYQKLGLKVLTRDELLRNGKKYHVLQFGSQESVTSIEPRNSDELPKQVKEILHPFSITIEQPFVCELAKVQLVGPTATGFAQDGSIILETTTPFYSINNHLEGSVSLRDLVLKSFSKSSVSLDVACSLVNAWSRNYWHWMVDSLTRLEGIEFYQEKTGIKPVLIIDSTPSRWQLESLKLLGYGSSDCIQWNGSRMQVERLVISSFRRHYNKVYSIESPLACRWIRQRMLSNISRYESIEHSFSPKIFISRRNAFGRRIINEDNVIEALSTFGFVTYILEEMSFLDQVKLFSQAEVIVAPHGAGLTNMIFAQHLKIIELFGSSLPPCFANLSRGLGFQYACLQCQSPRTGIRRQDSDMIVNISELRSFVIKMLS